MVHTSLSWVLLLLLSTQVHNAQSLSQPVRVRVCQNKHCKKRNANLKQCVSQLLPEAEVESSGCLSHCNDGPNIEVESGGHATVLNGIQDVATAAFFAGTGFGNEDSQDSPGRFETNGAGAFSR
mmetsp:Transcript_15536/g.38328  ORF Transcript_15536/g.38328 Transcript_15536/m.38328 type:complete len:124 (-) Transcript_15536:1479-1850(-)